MLWIYSIGIPQAPFGRVWPDVRYRSRQQATGAAQIQQGSLIKNKTKQLTTQLQLPQADHSAPLQSFHKPRWTPTDYYEAYMVTAIRSPLVSIRISEPTRVSRLPNRAKFLFLGSSADIVRLSPARLWNECRGVKQEPKMTLQAMLTIADKIAIFVETRERIG